MPDYDDAEREAKDHGNLMDVGVAEVEEEADKSAGRGQQLVDTSEDAEKDAEKTAENQQGK